MVRALARASLPSVLGALLAEPLPLPSAAVVATQRLARDDSPSAPGAASSDGDHQRRRVVEGRSAADGGDRPLTAVLEEEGAAPVAPSSRTVRFPPHATRIGGGRDRKQGRWVPRSLRPRRLSSYAAARRAAAARARRSCRRRRRQRRQRPNPRPPPTPPKKRRRWRWRRRPRTRTTTRWPTATTTRPQMDFDDRRRRGGGVALRMGWRWRARWARCCARPRPAAQLARSSNECTRMCRRDRRPAGGRHRRRGRVSPPQRSRMRRRASRAPSPFGTRRRRICGSAADGIAGLRRLATSNAAAAAADFGTTKEGGQENAQLLGALAAALWMIPTTRCGSRRLARCGGR